MASQILSMICPQYWTCYVKVNRVPVSNVNRKFTDNEAFNISTYLLLVLVATDVSNLMPRLFQLDATTDTFVSHEVVCPSRIDKFNCPFPVLQDDLYNVEQPGTKLLFKNLFLGR